MKYVHKFSTTADAIAAGDLKLPQMVYVENESKAVLCAKTDNYQEMKLVEEGGSLKPVKLYPGLRFSYKGSYNYNISIENCGDNAPDLKYSLDNGETWTDWKLANYQTIIVPGGKTICFKGNNPNGFSTSSIKYSKLNVGNAEAAGNIMSIIDDGLCNTTTIPCDYCFYYLFAGCSSLTKGPELPATILKPYCYASMFSLCMHLTKTPELPATTLANYCYHSMFSNCTYLTNVPELPALSLCEYCYADMFYFCTSLTTIPDLHATTLATCCYLNMFTGCNSLTKIPNLVASSLAVLCYLSMFLACSSLIEVPELPALTLANSCYLNMFSRCGSLEKVICLPALTLVRKCYENMFLNCPSLNYIVCLATTSLSSSNSKNWVSGVAATGTFIKKSSATHPTSTNGIPTGWTVQDI